MPTVTADDHQVAVLPTSRLMNRTSSFTGAPALNSLAALDRAVESNQTNIFVVASPVLVAVSISRALGNAGWGSGEALASPSGLADAAVADDDVIVMVENSPGWIAGASTGTVLSTVRRVFPKVGIVLLSSTGNGTPTGDLRATNLASSTSITGLSAEISRLVGTLPNSGPNLTSRHLEILQLIARGATTDEAGAVLGIASKTVNNHLSAAYQRLGARNLTQAVLAAARAGLIDTGTA
jgi:DNA-binding CsgD family transcriptional regulator